MNMPQTNPAGGMQFAPFVPEQILKTVPQPLPSILVAESIGFPQAAAETLCRMGNLRLADLSRDGLLKEVSSVDVLWTRLRNRIDAEIMEAAPRLKIIVTATTGLNHIDLEEAKRRNIQILSLTGEKEFLKEVRATAEHTIGLILSLLRNVTAASASVIKGEWDRNPYRGDELYGKTAGVVGYGRLGRIVARYLRGFEMQVLTYDPNIAPSEVEAGVEMVPLQELLGRSDIITLHVNLCDETKGLFGTAEFAMMKQGARLINTARGELIDEEALLEALRSNRLAGAALDVISDENTIEIKHHPLIRYARRHNNLLITPHLGGCTGESMEKTEMFLAAKLGQLIAAQTKSSE